MENRFSAGFKKAGQAFDHEYAAIMDDLKGLSMDEVEGLSLNTTNRDVYEQLLLVVEEASAKNLAMAQLTSKIKQLGDVAVSIAKKVPGLNQML